MDLPGDDDDGLGTSTGKSPLLSASARKALLAVDDNNRCVDCNEPNPEWASVTLGAFVCLKCSGQHRSLGVHKSFVRSCRELLRLAPFDVSWRALQISASAKHSSCRAVSAILGLPKEIAPVKAVDIQRISFGISIATVTLDGWSDEQLTFMRLGGNKPLKQFLAENGVDLTAPHSIKYSGPVPELYRRRLSARVYNQMEPEALPEEDEIKLTMELRDLQAAAATTKTVKAPATWVPDSFSKQCQLCDSKFTALKRRHHCRRCGKLCCSSCAPAKNSRPIPEWKMKEPVRHCRECYQSPMVFSKNNKDKK